MEIRCNECGSPRFRRSHVRLKDVFKLPLFRYPVRCSACFSRGYAPIFAAFSSNRKPMKRSSN